MPFQLTKKSRANVCLWAHVDDKHPLTRVGLGIVGGQVVREGRLSNTTLICRGEIQLHRKPACPPPPFLKLSIETVGDCMKTFFGWIRRAGTEPCCSTRHKSGCLLSVASLPLVLRHHFWSLDVHGSSLVSPTGQPLSLCCSRRFCPHWISPLTNLLDHQPSAKCTFNRERLRLA